jgi:predicted permease
MRALRRFLVRLTSSITRRQDEGRLQEEVEGHLALQTADNIRAGMTPEEARRQAVLKFGAVEAVKEGYRDRQSLPPIEHLVTDVRYALRSLRRSPGFTAVAVITLALGLGANIAIFALVHALLLRSLPVDKPHELYRFGDTTNCCVNNGLQGSYSLYSFRLFENIRAAVQADFLEIAAFQANTQPMGVRYGNRVVESLPSQYVSANYFQTLGVRAAAGRLLQTADDDPGAAPVVVMSYHAWTQRFGRDSSLVGNTVQVDGRPMTVLGVTAQGFFGETIRPNPTGIWIPLGQEPAIRGVASLIDKPGQDWLYAIGRLRPDVQPEQTSVRATAALRQWLSDQAFVPAANRPEIAKQQIVIVSAGGGVPLLRQQFGKVLRILFGTSMLVLIIACANLANLLLARANRGQAAIRLALGISRSRLLRQSLVEGVLLALAGSLVAVWAAAVSVRLLVAIAFPGVQYVPIEAMTWRTWAFALSLATVTGLLFTAGPAWAMSRVAPLSALSGVGRSGHVRAFVPRRALVIAQVALSFVLLTGAGLLSRSLGNLESQELGFVPEHRTLVRINPPPLAGQRERLIALYASLRERLSRIPGVQEVSYSLYGPMQGDNWSGGISIAGRAANPASPITASWNRVGPRYFEAIGTRLLRGRLFNDLEIAEGPRVCVVNDAFRRRFFENADPIGARVGIGGAARAADYEIVGVVEDVKYIEPREAVRPMIFLPAFQTVEYADANSAGASVQARSMALMRTLVIRAEMDAVVLEPAIRATIGDVDRDMPVMNVVPYTDQVSTNFRTERLMAHLTSVYGLLALILAALGLYGVTAFWVAQQTREIGLRMALGADRNRILRTVLRRPLVEALVGLCIGLPLAFAGSQLLASQLYGVEKVDARIWGVTATVLLASIAIAAILPARRAARVDPLVTLRYE